MSRERGGEEGERSGRSVCRRIGGVGGEVSEPVGEGVGHGEGLEVLEVRGGWEGGGPGWEGVERHDGQGRVVSRAR